MDVLALIFGIIAIVVLLLGLTTRRASTAALAAALGFALVIAQLTGLSEHVWHAWSLHHI